MKSLSVELSLLNTFFTLLFNTVCARDIVQVLQGYQKIDYWLLQIKNTKAYLKKDKHWNGIRTITAIICSYRVPHAILKNLTATFYLLALEHHKGMKNSFLLVIYRTEVIGIKKKIEKLNYYNIFPLSTTDSLVLWDKKLSYIGYMYMLTVLVTTLKFQ